MGWDIPSLTFNKYFVTIMTDSAKFRGLSFLSRSKHSVSNPPIAQLGRAAAS